jgi:hypothetical protein
VPAYPAHNIAGETFPRQNIDMENTRSRIESESSGPFRNSPCVLLVQPNEFGRLVRLDEVENGIVSAEIGKEKETRTES